MATKAKKKSKPEEFVLMGRTRALLGEVWDIWRDSLGHTPTVAKKMMTAAVKELHQADAKIAKKKPAAKKAIKKVVKKAVKKIAKKK